GWCCRTRRSRMASAPTRSSRAFCKPCRPRNGHWRPMFGLRRFSKPAGRPANDAAASPDPLRIDAEELLRRLEWTVIRRLDGALQGDYRTLFRGFGLDLADLREYQPGDDVRHIDWNVTARLQ